MENRKSRILEEVFESVQDLHEAGVLSEQRLVEFEALCHLNLAQHLRMSIKHPEK